MEKRIKLLLKMIKGSLILTWVVGIVAVILGETSCFVDFAVEPHSQDEFICNGIAICITIIGLPLVVKIFNLCTTRSLRRMDNDEALDRYGRYAYARSIAFMLMVGADVVIYYMTMNITGAMCALCVLVFTLVCWPKREQIVSYLEKVNQE